MYLSFDALPANRNIFEAPTMCFNSRSSQGQGDIAYFKSLGLAWSDYSSPGKINYVVLDQGYLWPFPGRPGSWYWLREAMLSRCPRLRLRLRVTFSSWLRLRVIFDVYTWLRQSASFRSCADVHKRTMYVRSGAAAETAGRRCPTKSANLRRC